MQARELTNYPAVFDGIYWGAFIYEKNQHLITPEIITNRNQFVEEYNIKKRKVNLPDYVDKHLKEMVGYLDHIECYITNDKKYVLISSPYTDSNNNDYLNKDWKLIFNLYSKGSYTYMKVINMKTKSK
jgi:hypothetical protein